MDASVDELHACQMERSVFNVETLSDLIALLPVTAANGLHYMNIHCALCNGYDYPNVIFWSIYFGCSRRDFDIDSELQKTTISLVATNCYIIRYMEPVFQWEVEPFRLFRD